MKIYHFKTPLTWSKSKRFVVSKNRINFQANIFIFRMIKTKMARQTDEPFFIENTAKIGWGNFATVIRYYFLNFKLKTFLPTFRPSAKPVSLSCRG
jgi:hypothetical protein